MFDVGEFRFKAYQKPVVLRMAPHIRTNETDEESAHAILLLYIPWPKDGEANLFRGEESAVSAFATLKSEGKVPKHVLTQIESTKHSEEMLNDLGDVAYNDKEDGSNVGGNEEQVFDGDSDVDDMEVLMEDKVDPENVSGERRSGTAELESTYTTVTPATTTTAPEGVQFISKEQCTYYQQYIKQRTTMFLNQYMYDNTTMGSTAAGSTTSSSSSSNSRTNTNVTNRIPLENDAARSVALAEWLGKFTPDQTSAFNAMMPYIIHRKGIIQFVSGGAGVGKSKYIDCIVEKTRLHFGKQPGMYGSVLTMAPTGCSARNVGGFTWQSALGKNRDKNKKDQLSFLSQQKAEEVYHRIKGVKLFIIDEISMVSLESLHEISTRICEAICSSISDRAERAAVMKQPFAGVPTIFVGDLYQLSCVGGTPLYATGKLNLCATAGQKIWRSIKLYHNLKTSTRFTLGQGNDSSPLESFLNGARIGNPSQRYITMLNTQICINYTDACNKSDEKSVWLTSTHKEKEPINRFMFEKLKAKGAFHMDVLAKHTRSDCSNDNMTRQDRELYYSKIGKKKAPILLRLAIGSRVKVTQNLGTQVGMYYIIFYLIVLYAIQSIYLINNTYFKNVCCFLFRSIQWCAWNGNPIFVYRLLSTK